MRLIYCLVTRRDSPNEIYAAMHESFTLGNQQELKQVGYDYIQLGPRALLEAADERKLELRRLVKDRSASACQLFSIPL